MRTASIFSSIAVILSIAANSPLFADNDKLFAITPEQAAADIEGDFNKAGRLIDDNAIRAAREQLSLIKYNISKYRRFIPSDRVDAYNGRISALKNTVTHKVDSLVKVNLAIVAQNGSQAGYEFRQYLAVQAGLYETELLPVDNALAEHTEKKVPDENQQREPLQETAVQSAAPAPALSPEEEQARDENERGRATALSTTAKIRGLLDGGNIDEAFTVFQIHEQYLRKFLEANQFSSLKGLVDSTSTQQQKSRVKATEKARSVERLLDQDRVTDAFAELQDERESLKKSLDPEEMRALEKKVSRAYSAFLQKQASANRTMREIRDLLAAKDAENAYSIFEMSRSDLEKYLRPDAFNVLQNEVAKAYGSVQDRKKLSVKVQHDVQLLCKAGKATEAVNLFAGNQNLLQQYLLPKDYSALEADLGRAKRELNRQQTQAASTAATVESLLSARRVQAAWSLFDTKKESLKKYLTGKTRFQELKERVVSAYDDLREAQSKALRTSNKLTSLCDRHEGRKAYALFQQESPNLRKYSAPDVFTRLESRVTIANAAYDAKQNAARNSCARIGSLLSQKQIVRAHAEYRKAADDISFYLAGDPAADSLQKRESRAWDSWQERNRWAASTVRQIRGFISDRRGNLACAQFQSTRAELKKYIEPQALAKLDADAALAGRTYARNKAAAELNASLVLSLLAQKQTEDACATFDTLENDLRFYCAPAAFNDLKTRVESSNNLLKGKKGEAQRIIASINDQIADERGDSASALFSGHSDLLIKYCTAQTYNKTSRNVAKAKNEYEKNVHEAKNLSARLKTMAVHDREEEAAYEQFKEKRGYLAHYLDKSSFSSLEAALRAPYNAFMAHRKESQVIAVGLKRMLRDEQYSIAKFQFDQNNRQLARFLPADEYREIMTKVTAAYENSIHGRTSANTTAEKIRGLLNEGRNTDAYLEFKESRATLEQYLPESGFTSLQTEVTAAREEQERKTGKARDYAKMLKQRVAKKQTWEAYRDFKLNRTELSEYLDAQTYADLETTVVNAYEEAHKKSGAEK